MTPPIVPPAWRGIANEAEACLSAAQAIECENLPLGQRGGAVLPALVLALAILRGSFAVADAIRSTERDHSGR